MRLIIFGLILAAVGCSGPVDPVQPDSCSVSVQSTWPANGSTTAHYRQHIEFYLSAPVKEAEILTDIPGSQWMNDEGTVVGFTPDADLEASTTYDIGLSYCGGTPNISFTTSSHGAAVTDLGSMVGNTFYADLSTIRFTSGGSVSDILLSIFDRGVLVQVLDIVDNSLSFRFGVAKIDTGFPEQDTCYRTLDQSDVDFSTNPLFTYATDLLQFDAFLTQLSLRDFILEGSIEESQLNILQDRLDVLYDELQTPIIVMILFSC